MPKDKTAREILKRFEAHVVQENKVENFYDEGYAIDVDTALKQLRELVEGKKQTGAEKSPLKGERRTIQLYGYNQAISDIAKLFGGGR